MWDFDRNLIYRKTKIILDFLFFLCYNNTVIVYGTKNCNYFAFLFELGGYNDGKKI